MPQRSPAWHSIPEDHCPPCARGRVDNPPGRVHEAPSARHLPACSGPVSAQTRMAESRAPGVPQTLRRAHSVQRDQGRPERAENDGQDPGSLRNEKVRGSNPLSSTSNVSRPDRAIGPGGFCLYPADLSRCVHRCAHHNATGLAVVMQPSWEAGSFTLRARGCPVTVGRLGQQGAQPPQGEYQGEPPGGTGRHERPPLRPRPLSWSRLERRESATSTTRTTPATPSLATLPCWTPRATSSASRDSHDPEGLKRCRAGRSSSCR